MGYIGISEFTQSHILSLAVKGRAVLELPEDTLKHVNSSNPEMGTWPDFGGIP